MRISPMDWWHFRHQWLSSIFSCQGSIAAQKTYKLVKIDENTYSLWSVFTSYSYKCYCYALWSCWDVMRWICRLLRAWLLYKLLGPFTETELLWWWWGFWFSTWLWVTNFCFGSCKLILVRFIPLSSFKIFELDFPKLDWMPPIPAIFLPTSAPELDSLILLLWTWLLEVYWLFWLTMELMTPLFSLLFLALLLFEFPY